MIAGKIVLEDNTIEFTANEDLTVTFTVTDTVENKSETHTVPQATFLKALAIAVHNDGMPDYIADYPDAESIIDGIRWIP